MGWCAGKKTLEKCHQISYLHYPLCCVVLCHIVLCCVVFCFVVFFIICIVHHIDIICVVQWPWYENISPISVSSICVVILIVWMISMMSMINILMMMMLMTIMMRATDRHKWNKSNLICYMKENIISKHLMLAIWAKYLCYCCNNFWGIVLSYDSLSKLFYCLCVLHPFLKKWLSIVWNLACLVGRNYCPDIWTKGFWGITICHAFSLLDKFHSMWLLKGEDLKKPKIG